MPKLVFKKISGQAKAYRISSPRLPVKCSWRTGKFLQFFRYFSFPNIRVVFCGHASRPFHFFANDLLCLWYLLSFKTVSTTLFLVKIMFFITYLSDTLRLSNWSLYPPIPGCCRGAHQRRNEQEQEQEQERHEKRKNNNENKRKKQEEEEKEEQKQEQEEEEEEVRRARTRTRTRVQQIPRTRTRARATGKKQQEGGEPEEEILCRNVSQCVASRESCWLQGLLFQRQVGLGGAGTSMFALTVTLSRSPRQPFTSLY